MAALIGSTARADNFIVFTLNDSGPGSLREAIAQANSTPGADTIHFSVSGTINLASTLPDITDPAGLTIDGTGMDVTVNNYSPERARVIIVRSEAILNLEHLTVIGGGLSSGGTVTVTNSTFSGNSAVHSGGGGIRNDGTLTVTNSTFSGNSAYNGGGIRNDGTLTVTNSTFSGNSAGGGGGGILNWGGTLTVTNSTFSGNSAYGNDGGGDIFNGNGGTLTVTNSTFSGNSAYNGGGGGGISNFNGGTLTVTNSTFSGNSAYGHDGGGGIHDHGGGGIRNYGGTVNLANTIVANSEGNADCVSDSGGVINATGLNLVEDGSCDASSDTEHVHFITGDPMLGPLADNGGPTQTFALLAGSPAIDKADDTICAAPPVNYLDQRGVNRQQQGGAHCDLGAFELIQSGPDCSKAKPSIALLWPPNHRFVPISIQEVTDSEGAPLTIKVTSIYQDEAVNAAGSGNTAPDGQIDGTGTAQVRAERVGDSGVPGNGRVYHLGFTAEDGKGGSCQGEVLVGVPHNPGKTPVDDGALYDSTVVPAP